MLCDMTATELCRRKNVCCGRGRCAAKVIAVYDSIKRACREVRGGCVKR